MDVKQYFRKVREVEAGLPDEYTVLISLETSDGGKAGMMSEVERSNAARMIVEGRSLVATSEQAVEFRAQQAAAKAAADKADMAKRIQLAIVSDPELHGHLSGRRGSGPQQNGK